MTGSCSGVMFLQAIGLPRDMLVKPWACSSRSRRSAGAGEDIDLPSRSAPGPRRRGPAAIGMALGQRGAVERRFRQIFFIALRSRASRQVVGGGSRPGVLARQSAAPIAAQRAGRSLRRRKQMRLVGEPTTEGLDGHIPPLRAGPVGCCLPTSGVASWRSISDLVDGLDTVFYAEGDGRRNTPYEPRMMISTATARRADCAEAARVLAAGNCNTGRCANFGVGTWRISRRCSWRWCVWRRSWGLRAWGSCRSTGRRCVRTRASTRR